MKSHKSATFFRDLPSFYSIVAVFLALLVSTVSAANIFAAEFEYKSQNGKILAPILEEGTTVLIHLDLKKVDLEAVIDLAEKGIEKLVPMFFLEDTTEKKETAEETLKELAELTKGMFAKLLKDGNAEHLYIMFNANDMDTLNGPVFLVPVGTKTKDQTDAIRRVAGELDMKTTFVRHGFVWAVATSEWNADRVWEYVGTRFRELTPEPSPELDEAFLALEAAGDAAQLVVLLPQQQTEELFEYARLSKEMIEQASRHNPPGSRKIMETMIEPQRKIFDVLLKSYRWGGLAVQVEKPKATLLVQMKTTEAAALLRRETIDVITPLNELIMLNMANYHSSIGGIRDEMSLAIILMRLGQDALNKLLPEPKDPIVSFTLDESNFPQALELLDVGHKKFREEFAIAEKKGRCRANLAKIGRAFYTHYEQNQEFPPAYSVDDNDKPLHSWRVLLLPSLGEDELFEQIKLDEPWDSEHNKQFHSKMPEIYRCPDRYEADLAAGKKPDPSLTDYALVTGKGCMFDGKKKPSFNDNPFEKLAVFERKPPVNWMSPVDIPQEEAEKGVNQAARGIGSVHEGGANAAPIFNSVQFLEDDISEEELRKRYKGDRNNDEPEDDFGVIEIIR